MVNSQQLADVETPMYPDKLDGRNESRAAESRLDPPNARVVQPEACQVAPGGVGGCAVHAREREAEKVIDIALLDHVIVSDIKADPQKVGHYWFREADLS